MQSTLLTKNEIVEVRLMDIAEAAKLPEEYCAAHFPDRYERAKKLRLADDRLRSLAAGALLYEMTGLAESEIQRDDRGKPHAASGRPCFSLSHSGSYAAIAISGTAVCGVDIERMSHRPVRDALIRRACTAEERDWLSEAAPDERMERFYRIWTMKESVSKALGLGLALPFDTLCARPLLQDGILVFREHTFRGACSRLDDYVISYVWT